MANPWDAIHANKGLEITLHLTEDEVGNINGWCIRGFSDPAVANNPPEIVLVARTRERFDDLAGQFVAAGLCAPAPWWPVDETEPPPVPEPPAIPEFPIDLHPEIAAGDYSRKLYAAAADVITVFPFVMPAAGVVHLAAAEFQGQPWARLLTVSATAGDLQSPYRSAGKVPDVYISKYEFAPGTLLYANTILTEEPTVPNSSGSGFSIVWPWG